MENLQGQLFIQTQTLVKNDIFPEIFIFAAKRSNFSKNLTNKNNLNEHECTPMQTYPC